MRETAMSHTHRHGVGSGIRAGTSNVWRPSVYRRQARKCCVRPVNGVKEIFMPALSSTMTEGKIVSWLKNPGDKVAKGESVVVVESDKADMDVESFNDGILGSIVINEGGVANVGEPIAYIAESEADLEAAKAKGSGSGAASAPAPAKEEVVEAPKPELVTAGAKEEKAAAPSPPPQAAAPPPPPPPPPAPVGRTDGRIIATPYAKKLAQQLGVDLGKINGTGPAGRITAQDVEGFKGNGASAPAPAAPSAQPSQNGNGATPAAAAAPAAAPKPSPAPQPAASSSTAVSELKGTTVPFNAMQSAVSKNMIESLKVPEFRVAYTIVTDKLDTLYKKLKPKGVTMTALLAKAAGVALAKHPIMYAATTKGGDGITYAEHVNVALAVTMPDGGLITPVIKDADSTDIYQISRVWADLVKRARSKQLAPDEYNSGNFTISNMGMYGADTFDAILPPGTTAILAVAASKPTVLVDEQGRLYVAKQMKVNLTADHRIIYGAAAAEFMQTLKAVIEDPDQLTF